MIRQSAKKGIRRYTLTIQVDEKLVPKIFDLADEMNFSKSLTVNTLLAIELGVNLDTIVPKENVSPFIPPAISSTIRNSKHRRG